MLCQLDHKAVFAAQRPLIALLLISCFTPALFHIGLAQIAADGVMPANRVVDNRTEDAAHVRIEAMTLAELEGMLTLQCVRGVIAFQLVGRVIEQHADIQAARLIDQAQDLAPPQHHRPVRAGGYFSLVRLLLVRHYFVHHGSTSSPTRVRRIIFNLSSSTDAGCINPSICSRVARNSGAVNCDAARGLGTGTSIISSISPG